jgi:hypothetical protein
MSIVNVNTIKPLTDDVHLNLQAGGSTQMYVTSAGALSGTGGSITNFTGLGQVLSVQSKSSQDTTSFSADSWVVWDADLNITVTPQSSSSKFLLSFSTLTGNNAQRVFVRFVREVSSSDTTIGVGATSSGRLSCNTGNYMAGGANFGGLAGQFLDEPATASAITYKLQAYSNSGTGYLGRSSEDADSDASPRGMTVVTVMEIAG